MTSFQEVFEQIAPEAIAAGWDYLDRRDEVDLIWIYISNNGHGVYTDNMYAQVDGKILDHYDAANYLGVDSSIEAQTWMQDRLGDVVPPLREAGRTVEVPTRLILRFRPADSDLHADFYYEDLTAGIPEEIAPPLSAVERDWFARLQATGNDSAKP